MAVIDFERIRAERERKEKEIFSRISNYKDFDWMNGWKERPKEVQEVYDDPAECFHYLDYGYNVQVAYNDKYQVKFRVDIS